MFIKNKGFISILVTLVFFLGCTTKKNTLVTRTYHNLTSRFNGYYYSNVAIKEGVEKLEKEYKDDYRKLLPIFVTPGKEDKSIYPDMDKAIKKSSTVIQRHAIVDKSGQEIPGAVKWIDDNYILISIAHYYKGDYIPALENLEYVTIAYKKYQSRYLAKLWLIRVYNKMQSISYAESAIDFLKNEKDFPKKYNDELEAITAEYFINRENYADAITHLTRAIALTKKKKTRRRYTYILSQLYQKVGDNAKAAQYYQRVLKMAPLYDMEFNARINLARMYDGGGKQSEVIKKQLVKMTKDLKNEEFLDQIYYTLAQMEEREGNTDKAIENLKLSVLKSTTNKDQKALSYLKLADIHYMIPDYPVSGAYYDSCVSILPTDYPNYAQIANKKNSLSKLIKNVRVINYEDSLQKVARLSEKEREKLVEGIIKKVEEEEQRKKEEEEQRSQNNIADINNPNNSNNPLIANSGIGSGEWYFYNPSTISFGSADFRKNWGDRKLEDNWRRSNKQSFDAGIADGSAASDSSDTKKATKDELKSKEYYLKNIPLNEEDLKKSNDKIVEAYYTLGAIYKEDLMNNQKSAETFEYLLKRYPENKYKLGSYYYLYRLYMAMGSKTKADYYKKILTTDYANTEYAQLINNPDYGKELMAKRGEVDNYYTETLLAYNSGRYSDVITRCKESESKYSKNYLAPKFELLKALSLGRTEGRASFESALKQIIVKYPKDDVKKKAEDLLEGIKLSTSVDTSKTTNSNTPVAPAFVFNKTTEHFWCILVPVDKIADLGKFKSAISNFNSKNYESLQLNVNAMVIDNNHLIYVKSFPNSDNVLDYLDFIKRDVKEITELPPNSYKSFGISASNFQILFKQKNFEEYMTFFSGNYLNQ